jgi:SAM-dependent methyltransferase
MLICPDCSVEIERKSSCENCSWQLIEQAGVKNYLKTKKSSIIKEYMKCYDQISEDDLAETIISKEYLKFQSEKLLTYLPEKKSLQICDVGGGQGFFAYACKERGYENITILDIAVPYLSRLNKEFNCFIADAENIPFREEFDIVFSTDVMEHVINMGSFLYCINKALKKEGKFVVRVPYAENLMSYSPHLGCKYDFVHLRSFNEDLLKMVLFDAGFHVEGVYYDGFWTYAYKNFVKKIKILDFLYCKLYTRIAKDNFIKNNTMINKIFCKIFIKPNAITCVARKIKDL